MYIVQSIAFWWQNRYGPCNYEKFLINEEQADALKMDKFVFCLDTIYRTIMMLEDDQAEMNCLLVYFPQKMIVCWEICVIHTLLKERGRTFDWETGTSITLIRILLLA